MQKFIFGSLLLTGFNTQLHAQETPKELPDMVVTATRTETAKNELATATTVYTREDIDRLQVKTLPELLKGSTGVDITQNGGYGQPAYVYMRGTDSSHVLVLIDGIKAGSVTTGTSAFELIPVDQIERVEIIRGPQSSLYGSEAIGCVIQIFTRKGKQSEKPSVSANVGGGSYDTHQESGTISGRWQNNWYSLGVSNLDSRGFSATVVPYNGGSPRRDAYRNTAVNARAGHRFDNNAEVDTFFMRAEGINQFDGYPGSTNNKEFVNQVVGTSASMDIFDNWRTSLKLGQTQDNQTFFLPAGTFDSRFNSARWNASWLNQLTVNKDHQVTLGSDYRLDEVDSSTLYNKNSRYDVGVFGELHSRIFDSHFINASLRWDENQAFGEAVTGNMGWRFNWDYGLSVFSNFGNAFKAPTFNDLYYPDAFGSHGNPNLKAEDSKSFEVGLAGNHAKLQWELRAFHTIIDNLIIWMPIAPNSYSFVPQNIGKSEIEGIEAEIGGQLLGWTNKLTGNLLNPKNLGNNKLLPGRSEQTVSYDVSRSFGGLDVGAKVLAQAGRFNDLANATRLSGYTTIDLRTAYHFDKNWMVSAKLNNVLDKQYQTISNYNTFGRNFFFSINYTY